MERALRSAMGRQRLTLSDLAERADVQRATLYAWFKGQRPEDRTLARVARALEIPVDELLGREPETPLAEAVSEQTAAIRDLIEELRESRRAQEDWAEGVQEALVRLPTLLRGEAPTDDPEPAPLEPARS